MKTLNAFLAFLCLLLSVKSGLGAGVVLMKETSDQSEAYWQPVEFGSIENFPTSVVITVGATKQTTTIPRYKIGEVIEFRDFSMASVVTEDHIGRIKAEREVVAKRANQCKKAAAILSPVVKNYDQVLGDYANGNVLVAGKWINKYDYEAQMKADALAVNAGAISEIMLGKKAFKNVRVTKVIGDRISIMHDGGIASLNSAEMSEEARMKLEIAFPKIFASKQPEPVQGPKKAPLSPGETKGTAKTLNKAKGIAELELNDGCWPQGVIGRWPQDVTPEQMEDLAKQGNANAQYLIALRLVDVHTVVVVPGDPIGIGVNASTVGRSPVRKTVFVDEASAAEGLRLLRKAAEQGHILSCIQLGYFYEQGKVLVVDIKEAVKWWTKAAENGSEDAKKLLGRTYKDANLFVEAYMWYSLASAQCRARGGEMKVYVDERNRLVKQMDQQAVEEAEKQIEEWKRENSKGGIASLNAGAPQKRIESKPNLSQKSSAGSRFAASGTSVASITCMRLVDAIAQAELNYPPALTNLGLRYSFGIDVNEDAGKAMQYLHAAANLDYPPAQYFLGVIYESGDFVPNDAAKAAKWYRKAADENYPLAQDSLGELYAKGEGVPKDSKEAVKWFQKAADEDFREAQFNLGSAYFNGEGIHEDRVEAIKWFQKAAEKHSTAAQGMLGFCYFNGYGVAKDMVESYKWLNLAATGGNLAAKQIRDAVVTEMTPVQIAEGERRSKEWIPKLTERNSKLLHAGLNASESKLLPLSATQIEDVRAKAEKGNSSDQYVLGVMYAEGLYVPKDMAKGVKWFRNSAEQGDAIAQHMLGILHDSGKGVPKDNREAVKWFLKSAEQGYASSQNYLGIHYAEGDGVLKDENEALKWFVKSAEQGDACAQYNLGVKFTDGIGVRMDKIISSTYSGYASHSVISLGKPHSLPENQTECRWPDSNRQGSYLPADFKSAVFTISPQRRGGMPAPQM